VGQTIGKVAAWEAWQAAQTQTLLEVIRDTTGCPTKALQSREPVGEVFEVLCDGKIAYINVLNDTALSHRQFLYTAQQAVVPEGYVPVPKSALDGALYLAGLAVAHTDFGSQHRADFKVCCEALLTAGKETV
jgi:hypothetical protein